MKLAWRKRFRDGLVVGIGVTVTGVNGTSVVGTTVGGLRVLLVVLVVGVIPLRLSGLTGLNGLAEVRIVLIVVVVVSGVGSTRHLTSDSSSLTNVSKGNILQINIGVHIFSHC